MKYILLVALLLMGCGPSIKQGLNHSCVVRGSGGGLGTGVLIKEDLVITAAHVIDTNRSGALEPNEINAELSFESIGVTTSGTIVKLGEWMLHGLPLNTTEDLALIKLNTKVACSLKLSDNYDIGDDVFTIGSPAGPPLHISTGVISSKYNKQRLSSCSIYPGNSGGGMFNNHGELIGIVTRVKVDENDYFGTIINHCSVFIEMKDILNFLGSEYIQEQNNRKKNSNLALISLFGLAIYVAIERKLLYKSLRKL